MKDNFSALLIGLSLITVPAYATAATTTTTGESTPMQSNADQNKIAGDSFLAKNKQQPGVITLPDGLQYKILVEGNGEKPKLNDSVKVHYQGRLINGKEFDSSYKRGEPATFPVSAVIPGWVEALQLMPVGSTWELYIPSTLAYGSRGAGQDIGPNETLIFKVELLGIEK